MTQLEPYDSGSHGNGTSSNGGYTNGNGFGNGMGYPQPVYAPGFPPTAFMSIPAAYPPGYSVGFPGAAQPMPSQPLPSIDPTHVTVSPTTGHGNGTGNGHRPHGTTPTAAPSTPASHAKLADLVVRAESAIDELERLARTAFDATAASSQAATDLQERLRLGVRMLQAFDVQIQRCEQVGSQAGPQVGMQLASQFTNQMTAVAQQGEMRVRGAIEVLEQRVNEAVPFLDERLRQAHEQVGRLVEERLAAAERRIEDRYGPVRDDLRRFADDLATTFASRLDAMVEERRAMLASQPTVAMATVDLDATMAPLAALESRVQASVADAERRVGQLEGQVQSMVAAGDARLRDLIRESTEAADGLLGTVGTASTLRDLIADEARASRRLADEAHATSRDLQRDMQDMLERCTIVRSTLEQQLHDLRTAAAETEARLAAAKSLRTDIENTLQQIAPLESSLRHDGAAMATVVETISSNVRQSLAEDMRNFSAALRGLASRAEHAFATARFDEFSAMPEPMTTPSPLLADPTPHSMERSIPHDQLNGHAATDAHAGSMSTLPIDTRRLTAEIMALDTTTLLRTPTRA